MHLRLRTLVLLLALMVIISASVFAFFKVFFETPHSNFTQEILAASLGTIMIAIITAILLGAQSAAEERKEKSLGVFQYKMKLYTDFFDFVYDCILDGRLDPAEIKELSKWATRIAMVAGNFAALTVSDFVQQCIVTGRFRFQDLSPDDLEEWKSFYRERNEGEEPDPEDGWIGVGMLVAALREDLGELKLSGFDEATGGMTVIDDLVSFIETDASLGSAVPGGPQAKPVRRPRRSNRKP